MINTLRLSAMALATVLFITASPASAVPITGGISFGGGWAPTGGASNTDIAGATGVDIIGDLAVINCAFTASCTGTYAPVVGLLQANYNDFTFAPLGGGTTPLWSFVFGPNAYSFELQSVVVMTQSATFLNLTGTGMLKTTGYDDTVGEYTFSGDGNNSVVTFSATNTAPQPVPESAVLGLLGFGLVVGASRLRRRPIS